MIPLHGQSDTSVQSPFSTSSEMTVINLQQLIVLQMRQMREMKQIDEYNSRVLRDERGGGWGYPRFILHDQLGLEEDEECQYLKDDSLYFRVQVEVLPACKPWLMVTVPSEDT